MSIVNDYTDPTTPPTYPYAKKEFKNNAKAMNALLYGISESEFVKVMHCETTKVVWKELFNAYHGVDKVQKEKLQTYRMQFESLKMKEEESTVVYFLRVDEVVNALKDFAHAAPKVDAKVSVVEEMSNLDRLTVDKLHGILTAYEMHTNVENSSKRETTFKASKKGKEKEQKSSKSSEEDSEDEDAHLVRKLKRGSGKFKGKLPLKCFNCGKIDHFASKSPYEKEEDNDDERSSKFKNPKRFVRKGKKFQRLKKSLYSKEDSDSFLSNEEENQNDEILFMAVEDTQEEEKYFDEEVEVDLEQELISALNEIKKLKRKN
ncbi:uncharacterized protein LOC131057276 [Cryptomeria japonica]|uniref:uncharacterized protein LOC131057276 n=1 Tax=Cryptomeria japonica TaxID=3369 RepID=UPI0027DA3104|nr:uncharacterized protein LOC131057276 [Cryptomeria japonica]